MATLTRWKDIMWLANGSTIEWYNKEEEMDKFVSTNYEKTADALLVQKWIAKDLPCDSLVLNNLILGDKLEELLAEAKRLEEEEKSKS